MKRYITIGLTTWMLCMVAIVAYATFSDINSPQYYGKTGIPDAYSVIDANFALIESGGVAGSFTDLSYDGQVVGTMDAAANEITITATNGGATAGYVMRIVDLTANPGTKTILRLDASASGDADLEFIECRDNASTDVMFKVDADGATTVGGTLGVTGNTTLTGDLDIDGGDITAPADLTITPTGLEVFIAGGMSVGDTTAVGDNNFKVAGTSLLVGAVTLTDDIDIDGGDITCPADLTITPAGADVLVVGGLTVGSATEAGNDNLRVEGDVTVIGNVTAANLTTTTDAVAGNFTVAADLVVTGSVTSASVATDDITWEGTITGTNGATIENLSAGTLTITETTVDIDGASTASSYASDAGITAVTEVTIDSKYAVVGPDASTGLMVQGALVTSTAVPLQTNAFATVFGATPVVVASYSEDPGNSTNIYITTITVSNFLCTVEGDKNFSYIAIGARP